MTKCKAKKFIYIENLWFWGITCRLIINKKRTLNLSSACFDMNVNQNIVMKFILLQYEN